jgi:hypothetical protein
VRSISPKDPIGLSENQHFAETAIPKLSLPDIRVNEYIAAAELKVMAGLVALFCQSLTSRSEAAEQQDAQSHYGDFAIRIENKDSLMSGRITT